MEKELIKKYKSIDKRIRSLEDHGQVEKDDVREALHGLVDEMDKENVRELLHDVLSDVYSNSGIDRKPDI